MSNSKHDEKLVKALSQHHVPRRVTDAAVRLYLESLDCDRAREVLKLYNDGSVESHLAIAGMKCVPADYGSRETFESAYLATEFLRKYKHLNTGVDTEAVAMAGLWETEEQCYATNQRFLDLGRAGFTGVNVRLLDRAVRNVAKILGKFDVDKVLDLCAWGPGATFDIKGENTSGSNKFQYETGITKDCYRLWHGLLKAAYPSWWQRLIDAGFPTFLDGNRVTTVEKDAEKDRTISIEPGINAWFQKGIGLLMVQRLLPWGCDLRDQTPNQRLARKGSVDGTIATVDLRNASNTVAYWAVNALMSKADPSWFAACDASRSSHGLIGGVWHEWEMFSSMGNGFTFPLQTVIFLAATLAVCEELELPTDDVVVYGDDILLPTDATSLFFSFIEFLGFSVNTKKTHVSGSFRESCGAHWWEGVDVTPIYLKERLSNVSDVFKLANAIRRLAHSRAACGCSLRFKRPWLLLYNCVPEKFRFVVSEGYGDGGFVGNIDEASPSYKRTKAAPYTKLAMVEGCEVRQVVECGMTATNLEHAGQLLNAVTRVKATREITFNIKGVERSFSLYVFGELKKYAKQAVGNKFAPGPVRWSLFGPHAKPVCLDTHGCPAIDMPDLGNDAPLRRVTELRIQRVLIHKWYDLGPWE